MKRYLVFCCASGDPAGGLFDFVGDFDTRDEAGAAAFQHGQELDIDYSVHVLDTETGAASITSSRFSDKEGKWLTIRTEGYSVASVVETLRRSEP